MRIFSNKIGILLIMMDDILTQLIKMSKQMGKFAKVENDS